VTRPAPLRAASAASSPADSALQSAPALPLRRDDDLGFPVAGVVLLCVLLLVALWAWRSRLRASAPTWRGSALPWLSRAIGPAAGQPVRVTGSVRLDAGARMHVVQWHDRELLVAINGAAAPVVLDRRELPASDKGARG